MGNLTMAMMLGSWKHICAGHIPGEAPADKSKFLHAQKDYLKILDVLCQALGKNKGATSADIYSDSNDAAVAIVIGTFDSVVGKDGGAANANDCKNIFCILQADKGNTAKTIFKSAYPARSINTTRFTKLGGVANPPAQTDARLSAMLSVC